MRIRYFVVLAIALVLGSALVVSRAQALQGFGGGSSGGGGGGSSANVPPGGRLTLTANTPVMTADATAQGTIRYDTYVGNTVPVAGTALTIGSDEITLILDATNHTSGHLYDVFAYSASGTLTLCAGPAWTNNTTRSQAIALSSGVWTNSGSMTHCFNNSVDAGPIASHAGTYLGTFETTANGQTGMQFAPAGAAGGSNGVLGLYNAYNRVLLNSADTDSTSTWTYATNTWRQSDGNSNNRISYVDGLGQSPVQTFSSQLTSSQQAQIGIDCNATTGSPVKVADANTVTSQISVQSACAPALGYNFAQCMEFAGGSTVTFNGGSLFACSISVSM